MMMIRRATTATTAVVFRRGGVGGRGGQRRRRRKGPRQRREAPGGGGFGYDRGNHFRRGQSGCEVDVVVRRGHGLFAADVDVGRCDGQQRGILQEGVVEDREGPLRAVGAVHRGRPELGEDAVELARFAGLQNLLDLDVVILESRRPEATLRPEPRSLEARDDARGRQGRVVLIPLGQVRHEPAPQQEQPTGDELHVGLDAVRHSHRRQRRRLGPPLRGRLRVLVLFLFDVVVVVKGGGVPDVVGAAAAPGLRGDGAFVRRRRRRRRGRKRRRLFRSLL
mmetsp:Transcript_25277/g.81746  ORF Transcript_25277/g.81746 Transcript_25277/m.81746 type:complete len:279 (+) Transcript_25277:94-930(+)